MRRGRERERDHRGDPDRDQRHPRRPRVDVLPFHTLGGAKYAALGLDYPCAEVSPPTVEQIDRVRAVFTAAGLQAV